MITLDANRNAVEAGGGHRDQGRQEGLRHDARIRSRRPADADRRAACSEFLQQLVNGITWGSVYALIALGYTMVYGILRLINFAHGDVFMLGAFVAYYAARLARRQRAIPSAARGALLVLLVAMVGARARRAT